ncbi:chorismate mutase [Acinetobacter sp. ANC 4558]|uniref:chorismate mutase n=1 Tax=Acinetobacter sp. ANC 4558 TaxID=1977876 RepID=UPI000A32D552|nr:chorismate mutase [Acinetobacter sp. ANC 4558]OTG86676.1 chorismate mutase [Acinetobacter sp. ANC 4558]
MEKKKVETLEQAQAKIEEIDMALVELIATRQFYLDQVLRFNRKKQDIESPKMDEVIARVRQHAQHQGLDPDLIESLYTEMLQYFLRRELKELRP